MKDILFTTADFIRSVTIVSDNLQDKYILSSIREAQDIEFQQVVGTRLYNRLKLMVEDESILLDYNEHYRELLDKAQYFIAYQTLANLTVNSTYKINNIGLNTISDDNVSTPSLSDTFKLSKYYTDKADHYKMILQNWLLKNKSYFPELLKSDISELSANVHSAASCNVFLGGARGKVSRVPSSLKDESQEANKPFTTGELNVTENGVYLPKDSDLDAFNKVTVNVQLPKIKVEGDFGDFLRKLIPDENKYIDLRMFDVSNVNTLHYVFDYISGRYNYIDIRGWDTSNVNRMDAMFRYAKPIEVYGLEDLNTSNVTDMNFMLCDSKIKQLDLSKWDVSKVTNLEFFLQNNNVITSLNLSNWDTSSVTNMKNIFQYCDKLSDLKFDFNTSNVTTMDALFDYCMSFTELDLSKWDVSQVSSMSAIFNDCRNLTYLSLKNWNMQNVTNVSSMFGNTESLTDLILDGAIFPKRDLNIGLHNSRNITVESLLSVLNSLPQLDDGTSYYVQLGSDNIAKLSDDQKAIATNKGWTLQ